MSSEKTVMAKRFSGFLPVVVDVETGGLNSATDALLEIAAVTLAFDNNNQLHPEKTYFAHVLPFTGANLDPNALEINKIDPTHPFRFAVEEQQALQDIFKPIQQLVIQLNCQRAVLVGHNASFDLSFLQAAINRCELKKNPFHRFTTFDTATLAGVMLGQTVLAKACKAASIAFNQNEAHSAIYDAEKTAELFCYIVNRFQTSEFRGQNSD